MEPRLDRAVSNQLKDILLRDAQREVPVVQSVSLFFWENMQQWVEQVAHTTAPFTIALSGPSGCGKSFIRETMVSELNLVSTVSSFTQDNYYRDFEADFPHLPLDRFYDEIDFDDPAHIRFRHLGRDMAQLKIQPLGSSMKIPRLRFGTPTLKPAIIERDLELRVTPFIITEGIHAFYDPTILPHYDLKIYVDVDEHVRRARWLERNRLENRGVTDNMWNTTVKCLNTHILPTRLVADLVINSNVPREPVRCFFQEVIASMTSFSEPNRLSGTNIST